MAQLNPYLAFNGNCEEALNFYADSLNGKIEGISRYDSSPMEVSEEDKNKIFHATFSFGEGNIIMASDSGAGMPNLTNGNNVSLAVNYTNAADMETAFNKLSTDGYVAMPLQDTFWGARFGMLTDKFGIHWMFNHDLQKQN